MATQSATRRGHWPALRYEELEWRASDHGLASRAERRRHEGPYRAAIPLTIARRSLRLADDVLAEAEEAAGEISRFDSEAGDELVPFSAVLLCSESAASSQIENLTASARAVAEAEIGASDGPNASVILANVRAMTAAIELADDLSSASIRAMHRALLQATEPKTAGSWRTEQVWIGGSSVGPHLAMFVPPRHDRVSAAISDLIRFLRRDDLPVLPQAAIAHAQFETSTRAPTATAAPGERSCTRCCAARR